MSRVVSRRSAPSTAVMRRFLVEDQTFAGQFRDVVLGHVVAERVKQLGDGGFRAAGHFWVLGRIELDEPPIIGRIAGS